MECLVGDNMNKLEWQQKVVDYIEESLEGRMQSYRDMRLFSLEEIRQNITPECDSWFPFGSRAFMPVMLILKEDGITVNDEIERTLSDGYFVVAKTK